MSRLNCQKCGNDEDYAKSLELLGGFRVRLCDGCRNEWHHYAVDVPEFRETRIYEAKRQAAIMAGNEKHAGSYQSEIDDLLGVLYVIGREWVSKKDVAQ